MKIVKVIKVDDVIKELHLKNRNQLAKWWGLKRSTIYHWPEYLPALRKYELLEMRPEFARLIEERVEP